MSTPCNHVAHFTQIQALRVFLSKKKLYRNCRSLAINWRHYQSTTYTSPSKKTCDIVWINRKSCLTLRLGNNPQTDMTRSSGSTLSVGKLKIEPACAFIMNRCIRFSIAILCLLALSSCSNDAPPHPDYTMAVDSYVITFSGDCTAFKGLVSVSTSSPGCNLTSTSFEEQSSNYMQDTNFKESYDVDLTIRNWGQPTEVSIHIYALCFSGKNLSMKCSIYKLAYNGDVTAKENIVFHSFPPGSQPTSDKYTFNIKL